MLVKSHLARTALITSIKISLITARRSLRRSLLHSGSMLFLCLALIMTTSWHATAADAGETPAEAISSDPNAQQSLSADNTGAPLSAGELADLPKTQPDTAMPVSADTAADETEPVAEQAVDAPAAAPTADEQALAEEAAKKEAEEAALNEKKKAEEAAKSAAEAKKKREREAQITKMAAEAIDAAVIGDYARIVSVVPEVLVERPELTSRFAPVLAYAYHKTGDTGRAVNMLKDLSDSQSVLMKAAITGEQVSPSGSKTPVEAVGVYTVKVGVPVAPGFDTIAYKKSLLKALKDAFLSITQEKKKYGSDVFDRSIAPYAENYYIDHYVLSQTEDSSDVYYYNIVIYIDTGLLSKVIEGFGSATDTWTDRHIKTILLSAKGGETIKNFLLDAMLKAGFPAQDMGSGDLTPQTVDKTRGAIVIRVAADAMASGKLLNSNFKSIKASIDYTIINGNNGQVISKISRNHTLVHLSEEEGKESALRKTYEKSLVPLTDALTDIESRMGKEIVSGLLPSVEASMRDIKEVFANIYKFYADEPVGTLILKNNTNNEYKSIRAAFSIKGYMDYPTEAVIDRLGPKEEKAIPIKAVFNNRVLELTDNTLLQSEIEVRYKENNEEDKTLKIRQPIQMYEKQALVWDDKGKVASFITYKDPVVAGFATKSVREYNYPYLPSSIVMARAIFSAMGTLGITYVPDPVPYSTVANVSTIVDRVQYPRQTLARKAGDCDDLVALLSAGLESLGIKAMPIDAPGHLFMLFDTGIPEKNAADFGFQRELYVIHDGTIWLPFETTLVGSPFYLAWEKGAENFRKWKSELKFVELRQSWKSFAPATLPPDEFKQNIGMSAIEKRFPNELESLKKRMVEGLVKKSVKGASIDDKNNTIIIYGRSGMVNEAIELAEGLVNDGGKDDPSLLNNLGNLYFMNNDYTRALKSYLSAAKLSPNDPHILVNTARAYLKLNQQKKAAETFGNALELDPDIKNEYLRLYTEINN
ncbi:MAG: hypothetical protein A3J24_01075 [Deltaproteobacteria bacterium RIFCSPLOWO2_02_FULL_53_8]|nr:MAG: hypothetical protein A3J24_01075 [Deltaproteobacteria bacterium RIFCSPLOWO2_02_FULL_53_8]